MLCKLLQDHNIWRNQLPRWQNLPLRLRNLLLAKKHRSQLYVVPLRLRNLLLRLHNYYHRSSIHALTAAAAWLPAIVMRLSHLPAAAAWLLPWYGNSADILRTYCCDCVTTTIAVASTHLLLRLRGYRHRHEIVALTAAAAWLLPWYGNSADILRTYCCDCVTTTIAVASTHLLLRLRGYRHRHEIVALTAAAAWLLPWYGNSADILRTYCYDCVIATLAVASAHLLLSAAWLPPSS